MWTIYQKRVQSFLDTTPFTQSLLNWHRCTVECQGYIVNIPFVAKSRLGKVWGATPCKRANTHSCEPCTYLHFIISLYKCPMQTHLITHSYSNHITSLQVECTSFWDKKWTRNTKRRRDPREPYLLVVNLWKDVKWTIVPYEPFKWSKEEPSTRLEPRCAVNIPTLILRTYSNHTNHFTPPFEVK